MSPRTRTPDTSTLFPLTAGLVPRSLLQARRPHRVLERQWMVSRSGFVWILLGGFFEPVFYLLSTYLGLGSLVADVKVGGQLVPYVEFVAPALLAASAMNGAMYETMNVFFRMNFDQTYASMLATPITAGDVVVGDTAWAATRGGLYGVGFLIVMAAMGMTGSWWALALVPATLLIALSFGAVGMATATLIRSVEDFEYVPTVTLPLFLFSATFFPATAYGRFEWVLNLSPLYHGVALLRALNLGQLGWGLLGHVAALVALGLVAIVVAGRRFERVLLA